MKKTFNYKPIGFLGSILIGISLQFYFKIWCYNFNYLTTTLCCFIILLFYLKKAHKIIFFTITSLLLFVFLGISSVYIQNPKNYKNHYSKHVHEHSAVIVSISKVLKTNNYYDKYVANVLQADNEKTQGKILINIKKDSTLEKLTVDHQLFLKPILKTIKSPLNPHQFNYKNYLAKQYIHQQVFIGQKDFIVLKKSNASLAGFLTSFRNKVQSSLKKHSFSKDELAVINALLLGQRQEISKDVLKNYTKAGAIHILAISGLHIGIVLLFLSWLLFPLEKIKYGTILKTLLIICILWVFAFITGLSASVVRAVTMFTFIAIGGSLKRNTSTEYSLITSAFVLLLIQPIFLFDVGFQLSYLAVFGIIYIQPILNSFCKSNNFIVNKFWQLFTVSISAQIGILPLSLYYFHQFPGLFLLTNLIIIPFLSIILFSGIVVITLALFNCLPPVIVSVYNQIIKYMNIVVRWISQQEEFLFTKISVSFLMMIALYILFITFFKFFVQKKAKQLIYVLIAISILQIVLVFKKHNRNIKQEFIIFHKSRKSILGKRTGNKLVVYHDLDTLILNEKLIHNYEVGENITSNFKKENTLIHTFKNQNILIVDSLGIYKLNGLKKPIVLLKNSPKINLDRLITLLKPKEIIADGSNYKSYIKRWEKTCVKQKTPFYFTGKNGAYILK